MSERSEQEQSRRATNERADGSNGTAAYRAAMHDTDVGRPAHATTVERRHILFANKHPVFGGGAEKNLMDIADFAARDHGVSFLIADGYVDPRMLALGPVYRLPSRGRWPLFAVDLLYVAWLLARHRVDLVHAHHRYPAFLVSLLKPFLGTRLLTTAHNVFPDKAAFSLWGDRVIAVSEAVAEWLKSSGVDPARIRVIHNGIPPPPDDPGSAVRTKLGLPPDRPLLLCVGRLTAQKNYPLLLDALGRLLDLDWVCGIVGEGEERERIALRIRSAGLSERVRLVGRSTEVVGLMRSSDLFVMSSAWEGFPYVVVEALACGLPIVATNVGGVRDGVIDGVTGYLVSPGSAEELADGIRRLLHSPETRRSFSSNGKRLFDDRFRIDAMLERTAAEYRALLTG